MCGYTIVIVYTVNYTLVSLLWFSYIPFRHATIESAVIQWKNCCTDIEDCKCTCRAKTFIFIDFQFIITYSYLPEVEQFLHEDGTCSLYTTSNSPRKVG